MGLTCTVSGSNGDFSQKSQIFFVRVFNAPAEWVPLKLGKEWPQETRMMGYQANEKFDDISFGLRSFGSSGTTAWNDMPAHLRNLDLSLSDFRQLLKTALFQTVTV